MPRSDHSGSNSSHGSSNRSGSISLSSHLRRSGRLLVGRTGAGNSSKSRRRLTGGGLGGSGGSLSSGRGAAGQSNGPAAAAAAKANAANARNQNRGGAAGTAGAASQGGGRDSTGTGTAGTGGGSGSGAAASSSAAAASSSSAAAAFSDPQKWSRPPPPPSLASGRLSFLGGSVGSQHRFGNSGSGSGSGRRQPSAARGTAQAPAQGQGGGQGGGGGGGQGGGGGGSPPITSFRTGAQSQMKEPISGITVSQSLLSSGQRLGGGGGGRPGSGSGPGAGAGQGGRRHRPSAASAARGGGGGVTSPAAAQRNGQEEKKNGGGGGGGGGGGLPITSFRTDVQSQMKEPISGITMSQSLLNSGSGRPGGRQPSARGGTGGTGGPSQGGGGGGGGLPITSFRTDVQSQMKEPISGITLSQSLLNSGQQLSGPGGGGGSGPAGGAGGGGAANSNSNSNRRQSSRMLPHQRRGQQQQKKRREIMSQQKKIQGPGGMTSFRTGYQQSRDVSDITVSQSLLVGGSGGGGSGDGQSQVKSSTGPAGQNFVGSRAHGSAAQIRGGMGARRQQQQQQQQQQRAAAQRAANAARRAAANAAANAAAANGGYRNEQEARYVGDIRERLEEVRKKRNGAGRRLAATTTAAAAMDGGGSAAAGGSAAGGSAVGGSAAGASRGGGRRGPMDRSASIENSIDSVTRHSRSANDSGRMSGSGGFGSGTNTSRSGTSRSYGTQSQSYGTYSYSGTSRGSGGGSSAGGGNRGKGGGGLESNVQRRMNQDRTQRSAAAGRRPRGNAHERGPPISHESYGSLDTFGTSASSLNQSASSFRTGAENTVDMLDRWEKRRAEVEGDGGSGSGIVGRGSGREEEKSMNEYDERGHQDERSYSYDKDIDDSYDARMEAARQSGRNPTPDPRRPGQQQDYDNSLQSFEYSYNDEDYAPPPDLMEEDGVAGDAHVQQEYDNSLEDLNYRLTYHQQQHRIEKEAAEKRKSLDDIGEVFPRWDSYSVHSDNKKVNGGGGGRRVSSRGGAGNLSSDVEHRPWRRKGSRESKTEDVGNDSSGQLVDGLPDQELQLARSRANAAETRSRALMDEVPAWQRVGKLKDREKDARSQASRSRHSMNSTGTRSYDSGPDEPPEMDMVDDNSDDASDIVAHLRRKSLAAGYSNDHLERRVEERRKRIRSRKDMTEEELKSELQKIWGMESKSRAQGVVSSDIAQAVQASTRDLAGKRSSKKRKISSKSKKEMSKKSQSAKSSSDRNLRSLKSYLEPAAKDQPLKRLADMNGSGNLSEGSRPSIKSFTSKKGTKRFRVDAFYESAPIPARAVDILAGLSLVDLDADQEGEVGPGILQRVDLADEVVESLCGPSVRKALQEKGEQGAWSDNVDGLGFPRGVKLEGGIGAYDDDEDALSGTLLVSQSGPCPDGYGKTCLAALVAARPEVVKYFTGGIAWIDLGETISSSTAAAAAATTTNAAQDHTSSTSLTFAEYTAHLTSLCVQLEMKPPDFDAVSPVSSLANDSPELVRRAELRAMEDAKKTVYKLIKRRRSLVIIDGVDPFHPGDIAFFRFARRGGRNIGRMLVATAGNWDDDSLLDRMSNVLDVIQVTFLNKDEAADLLLSTMNFDSDVAVPLSQLPPETAALAEEIVELCSYHPLVVGAVSSWLGLKAATVGRDKAMADIAEELIECVEVAEDALQNQPPVNEDGKSNVNEPRDQISSVYHHILLKTLAPSVRGRPSIVVQLCFAAFVKVFTLSGDERRLITNSGIEDANAERTKTNTFNARQGIPLEIVTLLWSSLLSLHHAEVFGPDEEPYSEDERKSHVAFIVEALCSLGTLHRREIIGTTGSVSTLLSVSHSMQESHARCLCAPFGVLAHVTEDAETEWNRALVEACSEAGVEGKAATDYFRLNIISHMIRAGMYLESVSILQDQEFMDERLQTERACKNSKSLLLGARRYVQDIEAVTLRLTEEQASGSDIADMDVVQVMLDCYWVLDEVIRREAKREGKKDKKRQSKKSRDDDEMTSPPVSFYAAQALYLIGSSLSKHNLFEQSKQYYQSALDILDAASSSSGASHSNESWLYSLGLHRLAAAYLETTDTEAALKLLGRCLPLLERLYSRAHPCFLRALGTMGIALFESCRYDAAMICLNNVVLTLDNDDSRRKRGKDQSQRELTTSFEGTNGIIIADSQEVVGKISFHQGEYENALDSLEDALRRKGAELGKDHFSLYSLHNTIGLARKQLGDTDGAARSFDLAITLLLAAARREKRIITDFTIEEENHIQLLLIRGQNHLLSFDTRKSLASLRSALDVALKPRLDFNKFRDRSRQGRAVVSLILHFLALAYASLEADEQQSVAPDTAESQRHASGLAAVKYFEKSLAWLSPRSRKHGLEAANTWYHQGLVLGTIKNDEVALRSLSASLKIRRNQLGDCDLVAITLEAIGDVYNNIDKENDDPNAASEADEHYSESIRIREQIFGEHSTLANVLFKRALLKLRLDDIDEAIALLTSCHLMRKKELGEQSPMVALTLYQLGCAQLEKGDEEGAAQSFEKIVETRAFESADMMAGMGAETIELPAAFVLAGQTLAKVDKLEMAEECFDEAISAKTQTLGDCNELADFVEEIGSFFKRNRLEEESWTYVDRADAIRKRVAGNGDGGSSYQDIIVDNAYPESESVDTYDRVENEADGYRKRETAWDNQNEEEQLGSHVTEGRESPLDTSTNEGSVLGEEERKAEEETEEMISARENDHDETPTDKDESSQGLMLQDFPQSTYDETETDGDDTREVAAAVGTSDQNADGAAGDGNGGGIAAAVAATAAAAIGIGALFGRNAAEQKDEDEEEGTYEPEISQELGAREMNDLSLSKVSAAPTVNPEIQKLYEMKIISQAEYDQMVEADRTFRHGDSHSISAKRMGDEDINNEEEHVDSGKSVNDAVVSEVYSVEGEKAAIEAAHEEPGKSEPTEVVSEESITNEFYGEGSAGEVDWRSPANYADVGSKKNSEADREAKSADTNAESQSPPRETASESVEYPSNASKSHTQDALKVSVDSKKAEVQQDSTSITDEFYFGENGTEQPADWQAKLATVAASYDEDDEKVDEQSEHDDGGEPDHSFSDHSHTSAPDHKSVDRSHDSLEVTRRHANSLSSGSQPDVESDEGSDYEEYNDYARQNRGEEASTESFHDEEQQSLSQDNGYNRHEGSSIDSIESREGIQDKSDHSRPQEELSEEDDYGSVSSYDEDDEKVDEQSEHDDGGEPDRSFSDHSHTSAPDHKSVDQSHDSLEVTRRHANLLSRGSQPDMESDESIDYEEYGDYARQYRGEEASIESFHDEEQQSLSQDNDYAKPYNRHEGSSIDSIESREGIQDKSDLSRPQAESSEQDDYGSAVEPYRQEEGEEDRSEGSVDSHEVIRKEGNLSSRNASPVLSFEERENDDHNISISCDEAPVKGSGSYYSDGEGRYDSARQHQAGGGEGNGDPPPSLPPKPVQDDSLIKSLNNTVLAEEASRLRQELGMELDGEEYESKDMDTHDDERQGEQYSRDAKSTESADGTDRGEQYSHEATSIESEEVREAYVNETSVANLDGEGEKDDDPSIGEELSHQSEYSEDEYEPLDTLVESQSEWNNSQSTDSTMEGKERQELGALAKHLEAAPIEEENDQDLDGTAAKSARTSGSIASQLNMDLSQHDSSELILLGEQYLKEGEVKSARFCFDRLVGDRQQRFGKTHPKVAQELFDIACKFLDHEYVKDSIHYFERITHLKEDNSGEKDVERTLFRSGSAFLLNDDEGHDSGLECMQEMLRIYKQPFADDLSQMDEFFHTKGSDLSTIGCIDEALLCYEIAADIWDKQEGREDDRADLRGEMAELYDEQENEPEAIACYLECIELKERLGQVSTNELERLGVIYSKTGDVDKAAECLEQCLKSKEATGDSTVDILVKLGSIYADAERNKEAIECVQKCIAGMKEEGDEEGLPHMMDTLGSLHIAEDNFEQAIAAFEKEVSLLIDTVGENDEAVAGAAYRLGSIYMEQGNHEKSLEHFERVASIRTAHLGEVHPQVADTYYIMASISLDQGDNDNTLRCFEKVVDIRKQTLGKNHLEVADNLFTMGSLCIEIGDVEKGVDCFNQVIAIRRARFGQDHPETAETLHSVGLMLLNMDHLEESLQYFRAVAELRKKQLTHKDDGPDAGVFLYGMGEQLLGEDDGQDIALQCFDQVLMLRKQPINPDYAATGDFLANLASLFHEKGRKEDSLKCLEQCAIIQREQHGNNSAEVGDTLYLIGRVCIELRDFSGASGHLNEALGIREDLGEDTTDIAAQLELLEQEEARGRDVDHEESVTTDSEWVSRSGCEEYTDQSEGEDKSVKQETSEDSIIEAEQSAEEEEEERMDRQMPAPEKATPVSPTLDDTEREAEDDDQADSDIDKFQDSQEFGDSQDFGEPPVAEPQAAHIVDVTDSGSHSTDAGDMDDPIANLIDDAGEVLLDAGVGEEADECFDMASDVRKRYIAESDPELCDFLHRIGDVCLEIDALDTALECVEEETILRKKHSHDEEALADSLHALGSVLLDLGDHERSMEAFTEEVDVRTKCFGPDHLSVSEVLDTIGALYLESGEHKAALDSFSQVARIQRIHLGDDHEDVAETLYSIGLIHLSLQDHEEARLAFKDVVEIRRKTLGPMDESVGDALNITGFLEAKCGHKKQALILLSKALDIRRHNEEFVKAADTLQQIGDIHRESQKFDLAIDCYKECLKLSSMELGDEDEGIADGYIALGNIQTVVGQHADAGASYQAGLFIIMKGFGEHDDRVMPLLLKMGTSRLKAGDRDQAEQNLEHFVRLRKERGENTDIDYVNALRIIGQVRMSEGDAQGAMEVWEEAFDTYTNHGLAYDHPRIGEKLRNLLDGVSPDEPEEGREARLTGLFSSLTQRSSQQQQLAAANDVMTSEEIVDQAMFFSTKSLDAKQFSSSTRSLRSSMKDSHSMRSRSLGSLASISSAELFFDEKSLGGGSIRNGMRRAAYGN